MSQGHWQASGEDSYPITPAQGQGHGDGVTLFAVRNYGVVSMKISAENNPENYSINHSALTYLLGPDGNFVAAFDHGTDTETLTSVIILHLTKPVE
jgi:hypothetical protein